MTVVSSENLSTAFFVVALAGAATALGAAVVFFPSLVKLASRRVLAASLSLAAGVMTYVSFVEIFQKSITAFAQADLGTNMAYIYATLSFFGGVLAMELVHEVVRILSGDHHHEEDIQKIIDRNEGSECCDQCISTSLIIGLSHRPAEVLDDWHQRADRELHQKEENNQTTIAANDLLNDNSSDSSTINVGENCNNIDDSDEILEEEKRNQMDDECLENGKIQPQKRIVDNPPMGIMSNDSNDDRKLKLMGLSTAFAIGLHNFPEGLATFVAALQDPHVGIVLGIAIGIHNIPEGLCVALPIYYATGNRTKAFLWGCLSGVSEPIAALLGWAVLANSMSQIVYAVLFGLVSGMMVIISMKELLPTAHRYDPEDTVVTYSFIGGMGVIALSLVLFKV